MAQQIQLRRDTSANWASIDPILAEGEMGVDTTLNKIKIGNGVTVWSLLPFYNPGASGALLAANNLSDLIDNTTARSNLGLGTAAVQDTTFFDAAGTASTEVSTHVGLSDPHTQYLKESDNLLITPQIVKVKISNAGVGEFTSLTAALASITDSDPVTKPYVIEMGAGVHTVANPATLVSGISIRGESINGTTLIPQNANQHLLILDNMCEVSFLNLKGISGSIGSGKAAIYAEDAGDFVQLHKLSIYDFDIGIDNYANTATSILYSEYCDINGNYSFAVRNRSNSSNLARLQLENFYTYASAGTNPVHIYTSGATSELLLNSAGLIGGSGNKGIVIENGGAILASDFTVRNFSGTGIGLHNINTGSGSDIDVGGAQFLDNNIDLSIQNPGTVSSLAITADPAKISIVSGASVAAQITDSIYGGLVTIGDIRQGQTFQTLTPISTFITKTGTTGTYTDGIVTAGTGLSVVVAAGEGFCYDVTNDYIAQVIWGITTLSGLSANTTYYICVDSTGTVQAQTSNPGLINKIYLSRVRTGSSSLLWIGRDVMDSSHHGNAIEIFARNMGSIYINGSIVTENGTRGLDVSAGRYQYGTTLLNPSGGTAVSWTTSYSDGSTGHTFTSGQTQINNSTYDNGSGTLVSMTPTFYRKDALYTSGDGATEKLFLVIGQTQYSTLLLAEAADLPIAPDWFSGTICLIATIIQQQGATHIQEIRSERPTLAFQASGVSAASVHGNLTGLSADDHTQYLLVNGTRAMSGNLAMGTNNITGVGTVDGVTVSAHASRHLPNGADPLTTGVPSTIDGTNATGTANAFARQDHIHAHGSQTDGTHHAAVTTSVNGFMSATDKTKLDSVSSTELGYVVGVTSSIQTQLDTKVPTTRTVNGQALSADITITGGSNKQVQYNNTSALAGAANVTIDNNDLTVAVNASPVSPPASNVKIFGKSIANRIMPAFVGPSGLDTTIQPFLARNKIGYWNPQGNSTTIPAVFGLTAPSTAGTATARNVATTNIATRMKRLGYITTATAGQLASHYINVAQHTTGTGAGLGGFHFVTRFVVSDAATVTGARHFCGMSSTVAAPTNVEPSTLTNSIGMAQLSTDATQWYLVYGGSVAQTPIALGTGLGAPTLTTTAWEIVLFSSPNDNSIIYYQVSNLGTGVSVSGTLSGTVGTVVPASTTLLTYRQFRTNNATNAAIGVDICSIYIETDN